MIEKVIKVGRGIGPTIHCARYKNVSLTVCGLRDGEVFINIPGRGSYAATDGTVQLGEVESVQIEANTRSAVVVRLRAEAA